MIRITSHVLDTTLGRPATNLAVRLERLDAGGSWTTVGKAVTDDDGRVNIFPGAVEVHDGTYRVTFDTAAYFEAAKQPVFYPLVDVVFRAEGTRLHCHIPLLLSPFGYSTYRGS